MIGIGDRVVCIRTVLDEEGIACVVGKEYTILDIIEPPCGHEVSVDIGARMDPDEWECQCHSCGWKYPESNIWWIDISAFRKIEYRSAHEELISALVVEKPDIVKIPEPEEV